jgi:hypothetical protein
MSDDKPDEIVPVEEPNPHPGRQHFITHENAAELAQKGREKRRMLAQEGLVKGVQRILADLDATGEIHGTNITPNEAWSFVVEQIAYRVLKSDNLRGMVEGGKWLGMTTGFSTDGRKEDRDDDDVHLTGLEDAKFIIQVANYYQNSQKSEEKTLNTIEADVKELDGAD